MRRSPFLVVALSLFAGAAAAAPVCNLDDAAGCEAACAQGDADGCVLLGRALVDGAVVDADPKRANALFDAGCERGHAASCNALGWSFMHGDGVRRDVARAAVLFDEACRMGSEKACTNGGALAQRADDEGDAATLYARGCDLGGAAACWNLYALRSAGRDAAVVAADDKALEYASRSCDLGDRRACKALVKLVGKGAGDDVMATPSAVLGQQCDAGEAAACAELGQMVLFGQLGKRDVVKGRELSARACRLGAELGCRNAGNAWFADDAARGVALLEQGCALDWPSCGALARRLSKGMGVAKDEARAFRLFQRACKAGGTGSCTAAADLVRKGALGEPDFDLVDALEAKAAGMGTTASCKAAQPFGPGR